MAALKAVCAAAAAAAPVRRRHAVGLRAGSSVGQVRPQQRRQRRFLGAEAVQQGAELEFEAPEEPEVKLAAEAAAGPEAQAVLEDMASFLIADLQRFLKTGDLTEQRYSPELVFTDPVTYLQSYSAFKLLMDSMRLMFKVEFDAFSAEVTGPQNITTKWAMYLTQEQVPWKPRIVLTGKTDYTIDVSRKMVVSHVDEWDSANYNTFFSVDALVDMMQQAMAIKLTPSLETPDYAVMRRTKVYEVRKYKPFIVAETAMSDGSGPAGGSGFGELAKFIFGGNDKKLSMDMTTPVFSTAAQAGVAGANVMQFVMSSRYESVDQLPLPESPGVTCSQQDPGVVAAIEFSGWPVDFEVVQAEEKLRRELLAAGLKPLPGYQLARYNDPATLPMLRRNEVLIKLEEFQV